MLLCQKLWEFSRTDEETEKRTEQGCEEVFIGLIWASNRIVTEVDTVMIFLRHDSYETNQNWGGETGKTALYKYLLINRNFRNIKIIFLKNH